MDIAEHLLVDQAFIGVHQNKRPPGPPEHLIRGPKLLPKDRPLSAKWQMIMTMQLQGLTLSEIAKRVRCTPQTVSNISRTERYQRALAQRMGDLDHDLLALKPKAIEALGAALGDSSIDVRLRAAKEFFQTTGTLNHGKTALTGGGGVSPEDLAKSLLAAARAESHLHVHLSAGATHEIVGVQLPAGEDQAGPPNGRSLSTSGVRHEQPPSGLLPGSRGDQDSHQGDEGVHRPEPRRVEEDGRRVPQDQPREAQMELALDLDGPSANGGVSG